MPVKFRQMIVRFWFFLSYLITTEIENFYFVEKQNKENFVKKIRKFRNRENM